MAAVVLGACVLGAGGGALVHSPLLVVRSVEVTGAAHTTRASVLAAAHLSRLMIDVDAPQSARRVETLPWVADARVERAWPSSVRISVVERRPVAVVARPGATVGSPVAAPGPGGASGAGSEPGPDSWALVDRSGRVLADVPQPPAGLTAITGVGDPGPPGSHLGPRATPAVEAAAGMVPSLAPRVAAVSLTAGGDLQVALRPARGGGSPALASPARLSGGTVVVLGGADQLGAKLRALAVIVDQVDLAGVRSVDLRVPQDPALTGG